MAAQTLFGQPAAPASIASDNTSYTMGMQFSLSADAPLTGIWFHSAAGAGALPARCGIFKVSDQSLVTSNSSPSWSGAAGSGWVRCEFDGSVTLTSGTAYKVCVSFAGGSDWYSATAHYWDSGDGASGITSGVITAPNNGGADGGQDTFQAPSDGSLSYPTSSFNAGNYWIDVEVNAGAMSGSGSGAYAFAGSASGVAPRKGAGSGTYRWAGSASGSNGSLRNLDLSAALEIGRYSAVLDGDRYSAILAPDHQ